jgi:hypothetical protein
MTGAVGKGMLIDGAVEGVASAVAPYVSKADAGIVVVGNIQGRQGMHLLRSASLDLK